MSRLPPPTPVVVVDGASSNNNQEDPASPTTAKAKEPQRGDRVEIVALGKRFSSSAPQLFGPLLQKANLSSGLHWADGQLPPTKLKGNVMLTTHHPVTTSCKVTIVSLDNQIGLVAFAPEGLKVIVTSGMRVKLKPANKPLYIEMHNAAKKVFQDFVTVDPLELERAEVTVRYIRVVPDTERIVGQFAFLVQTEDGRNTAVHGTELLPLPTKTPRQEAPTTTTADDEVKQIPPPRPMPKKTPVEMVPETTEQEKALKSMQEEREQDGNNDSAATAVAADDDAAATTNSNTSKTKKVFFNTKPFAPLTAFGARQFNVDVAQDEDFLLKTVSNTRVFAGENADQTLYGSQMFVQKEPMDFA